MSRANDAHSNTGENVMSRFRIRITSGQYAGRYVGSSDAVATTPEPKASREVKVPGTRYCLYEQMRDATECFKGNAETAQKQLKNLGHDSELIPVDVLDSLVGLSLFAQNIEERILRSCKSKFAESDADRVRLFFGTSDNANDLIVEKNATVEVLKEALALVRAKGYDRITRWKC
jgi:hypothetical protein